MDLVIDSHQVKKRFGTFEAVSEFSFQLRKGETCGLLGPNGAGKSTFISMLYGSTLRSSGDLKVFGLDPEVHGRSVRKRLGVVTQDNALDDSLTVEENMLIYAAFLGIPKAERQARVSTLLDYMLLAHKKDAPIRALSGGMKRRLVFVRALLGNPDLVILDEPTTGLDPAVRHLLWGKVKELKAQGKTLLLTTHYMHEAEILCDRILVLNQGKVIAQGSPKELISMYAPGYVAVYEKDESIERVKVASQEFELSSHEDSSGLYFRAKTLELLLELQKKSSTQALQLRPANLEDVFLKLTGQELTSDA